MTTSGVPARLHVEKMLNHTIDDVAEIYDRYDYAHEMHVALGKLDTIIWKAGSVQDAELASQH